MPEEAKLVMVTQIGRSRSDSIRIYDALGRDVVCKSRERGAEHVAASLGDAIDVILDGQYCLIADGNHE